MQIKIGLKPSSLIPTEILRQVGDEYLVHWQGSSKYYDSLESKETVQQARGVFEAWKKKPGKTIEAKEIIVQKEKGKEKEESEGDSNDEGEEEEKTKEEEEEEEEEKTPKKKPKGSESQRKPSAKKLKTKKPASSKAK